MSWLKDATKIVTNEDRAAAAILETERQLVKDIDQLERVDKATIRLLITLAQTLMDKNVIASADFTPAERQMFAQTKALKGHIW